MDMVFAKARELGEALLESDVCKRMKEAEAVAMKNADAAAMMGSYLEKRGQIREIMESENPDPGAMRRLSDEMDELQEKLQQVDDIVKLNEARDAFNALMEQVNQVLQFIVTGTINNGEEGCTGSCETCRGCH